MNHSDHETKCASAYAQRFASRLNITDLRGSISNFTSWLMRPTLWELPFFTAILSMSFALRRSSGSSCYNGGVRSTHLVPIRSYATAKLFWRSTEIYNYEQTPEPKGPVERQHNLRSALKLIPVSILETITVTSYNYVEKIILTAEQYLQPSVCGNKLHSYKRPVSRAFKRTWQWRFSSERARPITYMQYAFTKS